MDEQKLYDILGQKVEVPHMVDKKLQEAYARMEEGRRRPAKRRGLRLVRTAFIAAAAVAALCMTATAAYTYYVRQSVPVDPDRTVQGILSDGQPSWTRRMEYNEYGMTEAYYPNRDTVDVDAAQAQAILGAYLPECGYQWQIEDYTLTVEGYVLDEHTGIGKFYYSVEHPGGFPEGSVDREHGILSYLSRISVMFSVKTGEDRRYLNNKMQFVDLERSTDEKLYIAAGAANDGGWRAEDGLYITFRVLGETGRDSDVLSAQLELPGVKDLPTLSIADPATGEAAVELSAIGIKLKCGDADLVRYIALDYADGTRYVVRDSANELDNTDYGFISGSRPDRTLHLVFNRLADPSQVTAVVVDGSRYEAG